RTLHSRSCVHTPIFKQVRRRDPEKGHDHVKLLGTRQTATLLVLPDGVHGRVELQCEFALIEVGRDTRRLEVPAERPVRPLVLSHAHTSFRVGDTLVRVCTTRKRLTTRHARLRIGAWTCTRNRPRTRSGPT